MANTETNARRVGSQRWCVMDRVQVGRLQPRDWLGRPVRVLVDRPLGSAHPEGGFEYEVNYGHVPGFIAPDGEGLDAYVLGPAEPVHEYVGHIIAVVLRDDDIEDKLVVGETAAWAPEEIAEAIWFQERFFHSRVVTETS